MKEKILASLMVLGLLAVLPVAAQVPEEPSPEPGQELNEPVTPDDQPGAEESFAEPVEETQLEETQAEETQAEETQVEETADDELPKTASSLPLLAVLGCLSVGCALATRKSRRQS